MKKIFLFIFAACMVVSAWAECPQYFYDTIPAQRYITDFELVWDDNLYECPYLKFEDTFQPDLQLDRRYFIKMYARHANDLNSGCKFRYITQADDPGATLHWNRYEYWPSLSDINLGLGAKVADRPASRGGTVIQENLSNYLSIAAENGVKEIIFFVNPQYKDVNEITGETKYISYYGSADRQDLHNINYFTYTLPSISTNTLSLLLAVNYGEEYVIEGNVRALNQVSYRLQESEDEQNWNTVLAQNISTAEARQGKKIQYKRTFLENGINEKRLFRAIVENQVTGDADTSYYCYVYYRYQVIVNGEKWHGTAGSVTLLPVLNGCTEYQVTSELPVEQTVKDNYIYFTQPTCNIRIDEVTKRYKVKFLNADYTLLKTVEVDCGSDVTALAPANPTYGNYTFIGWNKDLTNIKGNVSVMAKYDIGNDYYLNVNMTDHKNEVFPFAGFVDNETRAMVGDKITFRSSVFATTPATLYYETAPWNNTEQRFLWDPNSGRKVADYTDPNQERFFDQEITIAYDANTQFIHPFEYKTGVRFYLMIAGVKVYSDPIEIDIYYPMTINSLSGEEIYAENTAGDHIQSLSAMLPARNDDTVRVYGNNGADGGCLSFARVLYPSRPLDSGLDEDGKAYFLCPGEQETINVDATKKLIVFDGVYGNGYPKQLDFTAEGFGKINGYYGEVVTCGGSIQNMPDDPTEEGAIFQGWQGWNNDYENDDYLHVPAIDDNILGFTAQFEYLPEVPQYQVRFYGKDGAPLLKDTLINEGENAVPPVAPEVSGFHFVGWDKPYTTITANTDITAQYGQDEKVWTVTFLDWDGTTLNTQQVDDGMPAAEPLVAREGYKFEYWVNDATGVKEDISHIWSDLTVKAYYSVAEGIGQIPVPQDNARKYMINGQIYIALPDGKVYNAQGAEIK